MGALAKLHPMIVHFPIALLLVVPFLVVLGLLLSQYRAGIHLAALALLVLGTTGAVLAVVTGLAASTAVHGSAELTGALDLHEQVAKQTTLCYALLTMGFLLMQVWFLVKPSAPEKPSWFALNLVWLVAALGAAILLARTGQLGGRMVHELGVRSGVVVPPAVSGEAGRGGHGLARVHHEHPAR